MHNPLGLTDGNVQMNQGLREKQSAGLVRALADLPLEAVH